MTQPNRIILADFETGFETRYKSFKIDDKAFPYIFNAYAWRGGVYKKRGTDLLARLQRDFEEVSLGSTDGNGEFTGNLKTVFSLETNSFIKSGSITISDGTNTFTEPSTPDGTLSGAPAGTGTINYSTGAITIASGAISASLTITFSYYPSLPVLGLNNYDEEVASDDVNFPTAVYFDQTYAYQYSETTSQFFDASFYKASGNPVTWNGEIYDQFWGINYRNALWVTNGVNGFHYDDVSGTIADQTGTTIDITLSSSDLEVGDYVFFNEVEGSTITINGETAEVTAAGSAPTYTFTFSTSQTITTHTAGTGIAQFLTRSKSGGGDGIRYYDGYNASNTTGFVNFAPPLESGTAPPYLMGAKMIRAFKNRLLFFGTYEGRPGSTPVFYPDRVRCSQNIFNGPPYYTDLFPANQSKDYQAYMDNVGGKGYFVEAGTPENIVSTSYAYDVMILGFSQSWRQLVYSQNEEDPFTFHTIDVEIGNESRFATITLKDGVTAPGDKGYVGATPAEVDRIDLKIPDQIYQIENDNNGNKKVTAIRDYENEWVFFSYLTTFENLDDSRTRFNNRTLLFNYIEGNFAVFEESYTAYGIYRPDTPYTWEDNPWETWDNAGEATWEAGFNLARFPHIACGNQQGFVLLRTNGTQEDVSLAIQAINTTTKEFTVIDHGLEPGQYVRVESCIGVTEANDLIASVSDSTTKDKIILQFDPDITLTGTYLGDGLLRRVMNFDVRTKRFPNFWKSGKKIRLSNVRVLSDTTTFGEYILNVFSSQISGTAANSQSWIPTTQVIYTKPEKAFLDDQAQIWHRNIVSMTGDTVQLGFTMNDSQMRDFDVATSEWVVHAIVMDIFEAGYIGGPYLG